jgi:hypothetical protein
MERSQSSAGDDTCPRLEFNAKTPALKGDPGALPQMALSDFPDRHSMYICYTFHQIAKATDEPIGSEGRKNALILSPDQLPFDGSVTELGL